MPSTARNNIPRTRRATKILWAASTKAPLETTIFSGSRYSEAIPIPTLAARATAGIAVVSRTRICASESRVATGAVVIGSGITTLTVKRPLDLLNREGVCREESSWLSCIEYTAVLPYCRQKGEPKSPNCKSKYYRMSGGKLALRPENSTCSDSLARV